MRHPKPLTKKVFSSETAQISALQALQFLASDEERLSNFLLHSGLCEGDLRSGAHDPMFLAGVMDYLMSNEQQLLAFAQEAGLQPEDIARLRRHLPGALDAT